MRWKLYNNPYYFACAASAEKHRTALHHYEGHTSRESLPTTDRWTLDQYCVHCSPHVTTETQQNTNSDGCGLRTACACVDLQHLEVESAPHSAEESTQGVCKEPCQDVGEGSLPSVTRKSSKRLPNKPEGNSNYVDQLCVVSDSDRMVEAMQRELHKVLMQVQELEEACIWARMEINNLQLRVDHAGTKGKSWPSKVYAKLAAKVLSIKEDPAHELSHESSQDQQQHLRIKNLENQLAESKAALMKTKKEITKERKAREILELICNELARKIGQDQVDPNDFEQDPEGIKKKHRMRRQGECKILETWREEKLQVKLSQAKFEVAHNAMSIDSSFERKLKSFLASATTSRRSSRRV